MWMQSEFKGEFYPSNRGLVASSGLVTPNIGLAANAVWLYASLNTQHTLYQATRVPLELVYCRCCPIAYNS